MARIAASEETRIRKLREVLQRASARGMISEIVGQAAMCDLLGIKAATLRTWLDDPEVDASGAFIRGGRGVDYQFNVLATIWVLIRYWERQRDEQVSQNLRVREMVAGDKLDGAPAGMTIRDSSEAYGLALKIITAEKEAGLLVDAAVADTRFSELVLSLRDGLLSAPQKLDPANEWAPEFRENFDNALADCMVLLRHAGQETLRPTDGSVPAGLDGARQGAPQRRKAGRSAPARAQSAGTAATA